METARRKDSALEPEVEVEGLEPRERADEAQPVLGEGLSWVCSKDDRPEPQAAQAGAAGERREPDGGQGGVAQGQLCE